MSVSCQSCQKTAPFGARFCPNCGTEISHASEPQIQRSEKRILTLVFADLAGSTKLAETAGLEKYDAVMQVFHSQATQTINAFGGVVLQSYGDGILAAFGQRKDGEDAALAGLAAGLALTRDMPAKIEGKQLRVGIHSGQVICRISPTGEILPQVTGFDVNLAARIQEQATIGTVKISETTHDFVRRIAHLHGSESGAVAMKGVSKPIDLYEVSGFDFIKKGVRGGHFLERDAPLDEITTKPGRYLVVGPAGIGKSAFLEALHTKVPQGDLIIDLSARSNLTKSPFVPILDWIRGTLVKDSATDLNIALANTGVTLTPLEVAHVSALITRGAVPPQALELAPLQLRAAQIDAVAALIKAILAQGAWLFYDDFHWTDDNTKAVI